MQREFGGLRLGEFEAASARGLLIGQSCDQPEAGIVADSASMIG